MIKRFVWFVIGAFTGALTMVVTGRKVKRRVEKVSNLTPVKVVRDATSSVRNTVNDVSDAVREGRDAMRTKENELRARVEGRASRLDDELHEDDTVLVDGEPVEPGRVVVLRQIDPGFVTDDAFDGDESGDVGSGDDGAGRRSRQRSRRSTGPRARR